jgi:hypothetical protein
VFSVPQRQRSLSLIPPRVLGFRGRWYTRGDAGRSGQGQPHHWVVRPRAGPRQLLVWAPGCSPRPLLLATSVLRWNINFWVFSWNCWSS